MESECHKNFDGWNEKKKKLEVRILPEDFFFLEGEVWWASLGVNLGREIDGKNEQFERPVVILKKINEDLFIALPVTSKDKFGEQFYKFRRKGIEYTIILTQIRLMSINRLLRLVARMTEDELKEIKGKMTELLN